MVEERTMALVALSTKSLDRQVENLLEIGSGVHFIPGPAKGICAEKLILKQVRAFGNVCSCTIFCKNKEFHVISPFCMETIGCHCFTDVDADEQLNSPVAIGDLPRCTRWAPG